jgi:hypothetical protein
LGIRDLHGCFAHVRFSWVHGSFAKLAKEGDSLFVEFVNRGLDHSLLGLGLTASQNTHAVNRNFPPSFIEALLFTVNHFTDKRWLEPRFMNERVQICKE